MRFALSLLAACAAALTGASPVPAAPDAWSAPERVAVVPHLEDRPRLAVDSRGNAVVAWMTREDVRGALAFRRSVFVATRAAGSGRWAGPTRLARRVVPLGGASVDVAVDERGRAVVVWTLPRAMPLETGEVFAASGRLDTGRFGQARRLGRGSRPLVRADAQGRATIVWARGANRVREIVAARANLATGRWSSPAVLSGLGADAPTLEVNAAGTAVVAWLRCTSPGRLCWNLRQQEEVLASYRIEARARPAGSSRWGRVERARAGARLTTDQDGPSSAESPRLVLDGRGVATLVWADRGERLLAAERPASGAWRAAVALLPRGVAFAPGPAGEPPAVRAAASPDGHVGVVWRGWDAARRPVDAVSLRREPGARWETSVLPPGFGRPAAFQVGSGGAPAVAAAGRGAEGQDEIRVARLGAGAQWEIDRAAGGQRATLGPFALAFAPDGRPLVAWRRQLDRRRYALELAYGPELRAAAARGLARAPVP